MMMMMMIHRTTAWFPGTVLLFSLRQIPAHSGRRNSESLKFRWWTFLTLYF